MFLHKMSRRESDILIFIQGNEECSFAQIAAQFANKASLATIKRMLQKFVEERQEIKSGAGKNTRYKVSIAFKILNSIDVEQYFEKDIDERKIQANFDVDLITVVLPNIALFTNEETGTLNNYHQKFLKKAAAFTEQEWMNEMERLAIDLSWKSAQIVGNTYSLLETEQLLKEKKTAAGKTKDEAIMLLNHKEAIDFIIDQPDCMYPLTVAKIENLHSLLIKDLAVSRNLINKRVGISGTNYLPLDNEWQIKEAVEQMCGLVNGKENVFEKALLPLVLIS